MLDLKRCNLNRPCPICGRKKHCQVATEGPVQCMWAVSKGAGTPMDPPTGYKRGKATADGGWWYVPIDPATGKPVMANITPEMARQRNEKQERYRAASIERAKRCWRSAVPPHGGNGHPRVAEYLKARGIDVAKLPGGVMPLALRYFDRCPDWFSEPRREGPAMVAGVADAGGKITAVHCTYLDSERPAKRDPQFGPQRKMHGACKGRAIRFGREYPGGLLVLAEGIETALSVMMATGYTAWACMSTAGIKGLELPQELVAPAKEATATDQGQPAGAVHTIVMAADLNPTGKRVSESHVGEKAAAFFRNRLAVIAPHVRVVIAAPSDLDAPELVVRDERAVGDGLNGCTPRPPLEAVDWNDVLTNVGPEAVKAAIERALALPTNPLPPASGAGGTAGTQGGGSDFGGAGWAGGDGDERGGGGSGDDADPPPWDEHAGKDDLAIIEPGAVERARRWLWERMRLPGEARLALSYWAGTFWVYGRGRYVKVEETEIAANILSWLNGFRAWKRGKLLRLSPSPKSALEVLKAVITDVRVHTDRMPTWLPDHLDVEGKPRWGEATSLHALTARLAAPDVALRQLTVLDDCVFDLSATAASGEVKTRPHSPSLFTATQLPFRLPAGELQDVLDGKPEREVLERLAPNFLRWCKTSFDDPDDIEQLRLMVGDVLSLDRSIEKIFALIGLGRSGKGYIRDVLMTLVGAENHAATSFETLNNDKFALAPLVGKALITLPDAHLTGKSGPSKEILKCISGQDVVSVRDLHSKAVSVLLPGRVVIFANEEPDFRDDSGALAGRLIVLPLQKTFEANPDPAIKASVRDEAPGLLVWALLGAIRLARMSPRRIEMARAGRDMVDAFRADSARIEAFKNDCLDVGAAAGNRSTSTDEIYAAYLWYAHDNGWDGALKQPMFLRRLALHVPGWVRTQPRVDGRRQDLRKGVAIKKGVGRRSEGDDGPNDDGRNDPIRGDGPQLKLPG